jgi:hypothetical protein
MASEDYGACSQRLPGHRRFKLTSHSFRFVLSFIQPTKKKSRGRRSGERGGHAIVSPILFIAREIYYSANLLLVVHNEVQQQILLFKDYRKMLKLP